MTYRLQGTVNPQRTLAVGWPQNALLMAVVWPILITTYLPLAIRTYLRVSR